MPNRGNRSQRTPLQAKPENPHFPLLRERIAATTDNAGIYRWKNEKGDIIYVGKAKNLKKRLSQYVNPGKGGHGPWRQAFLRLIADFDVTVTNTELEALVLETNLIKQLKPKYNVLMKDDKHYLYIRITLKDPYPRVGTTRRLQEDGAKYFGPYPNGEDVRITLDLLHEALGYRACRQSLDALNKEPPTPQSALRTCLEYQIGRCNGLCAGAINREEYERRIEGVIAFLRGNHDTVRATLKERMMAAAAGKKFELAAKLRNHLTALDRMEGKEQGQLASDTTGEDSDIVGVAVLSNRAHVVVLQRRNGRIVGEHDHELAGEAEDESEVLSQFLPQFYQDEPALPPIVLVSSDFADRATLEEWLSQKRGSKVKLIVPERGRKSALVQLAEKNAREKAKLKEIKWESEKANTEAALEGLQRLLALPELPHRIEGYDISHLGGNETVGSMVVMKNGKAANDHYRSFSIRTMKDGVVDDFRALKEVLGRRLRRFCEDQPAEEKEWETQGVTFGKAKKSEQGRIDEIHAAHAELGTRAEYPRYCVARHGGEIIAFGRITQHKDGKKVVTELDSLWDGEAWKGRKLAHFIARKILRGVKKGKVYAVSPPDREEWFGELGFRYVIKPPQAMTERIADATAKTGMEPVVMMWEAAQNKIDPSLSAKPDLIVIDGGKGQLSSVTEVMEGCNLTIPVIGLAKREEEVFVPDRSDPIIFPKDSQAKFLLMRLRDEAHRFANFKREKRGTKKAFGSALDEIPGIGEMTKKALLEKFGTVSSIKSARDDELLEVLTDEQLQALRKSF